MRSWLQPRGRWAWADVAEGRWLPHAVGLPVAWGCLPDPVLQPNSGQWDLNKVALPPARICVHSLPTLCPKQVLSRQADRASPCPHHPSPLCGRTRGAAPQLPPRLCSQKDTHTHLWDPGIFSSWHEILPEMII